MGAYGDGSRVLDREEQLGRELGREGVVPHRDGRQQPADRVLLLLGSSLCLLIHYFLCNLCRTCLLQNREGWRERGIVC